MRALFLLLLIGVCSGAWAADAAQPGSEIYVEGAKGYWFYKEPVAPTPDEKQEQEQAKAQAQTPPSEKDRCGKAATWSVNCGFVNPGMDFEFQAKQRDALMQRMSLAPDNPVAVEAFQRYNKWVVNQAVKAAQMWQWNLVQRPDLDPTVQAPISTFGIGLVSEVNDANSAELWKYIASNGGFLVGFTRDDCLYCHRMLGLWADAVKKTGIPFYLAPIDGKCLAKVDPEVCLPGKLAYDSATALQVTMVPALFLYIPDQTWIRIATGVVTTDTITSRISNFFAAYRSGIARGLAGDGKQPAVSFEGSQPALVSGSSGITHGIPAPTERDMRDLLGSSYTTK